MEKGLIFVFVGELFVVLWVFYRVFATLIGFEKRAKQWRRDNPHGPRTFLSVVDQNGRVIGKNVGWKVVIYPGEDPNQARELPRDWEECVDEDGGKG